MLAVLAVAAILAMQHVSERYSPALYPLVSGRVRGWLIALAVIAGVNAALIWLPLSMYVELGAVLLLLAGIATSLCGAFAIWRAATSGPQLLRGLGRLSSARRLQALRDVLAGAAVRGDIPAAAAALEVAGKDHQQQAELFDWLWQQKGFAWIEWFTALAVQSLDGGLAGQGAERLRVPLCGLLDEALADESPRRARTILDGVMSRMEKVEPFSEPQAALVWQLGFTLWEQGEEGASHPRRWTRALALSDLQNLYLSRLSSLSRMVVGRHDRTQMSALAGAVGRLQQSGVGLAGARPTVPSALGDSHPTVLLEEELMEQLGVAVSAFRAREAAPPLELPPANAKRKSKGKRKRGPQ